MNHGVSPLTLGAMDSGFMFTYAGGSFITGQLGDRFSPVAVVAGGLLGSTICLLAIVFGASTSIISNVALCGTWFLTCQLVHGAFQATGGPVNTAIMGSWFSSKGRGLIFGMWTCHQYVGDIAAAIFSAWILHNGYDWRLCITVPAIVNGLWALVNMASVPNRPEDVGITKEGVVVATTLQQQQVQGLSVERPAMVEPEAIGFFEAFALPNVMSYAIAFGFFKLVNYAMFFQLPLILASHFDPSTSNIISSLYSVGMMPGGIVCGWVSDLYGGKRACVIATFMGILCPLLLLFAWYMDTLPVLVLLILLAFMGCLVGGPNNIITSAVAADLADDPSIQGNNRALGTVTGIINGSGSVTAAFGQLAIPVLYEYGKLDNVGYRYVWYFLILCTLAGTSLMYRSIVKELYPEPPPLPLSAQLQHRFPSHTTVSQHHPQSHLSGIAMTSTNRAGYQALSQNE
jgi:sugar phosphate permease